MKVVVEIEERYPYWSLRRVDRRWDFFKKSGRPRRTSIELTQAEFREWKILSAKWEKWQDKICDLYELAAGKEPVIREAVCEGYLPPANEPCSICGCGVGERHK